MPIATSKVTAQGQISIPADVRKRLGIGPGSILEWDETDGKITVQRAAKYSWDDIHKALFGDRKPPKRTLEELKESIGTYMRERHARP